MFIFPLNVLVYFGCLLILSYVGVQIFRFFYRDISEDAARLQVLEVLVLGLSLRFAVKLYVYQLKQNRNSIR